uniref:Rho GTPase activating protein 18 n=1 Tax=Tetraodon nigroviridis TaxID=99883 RepID=H3D050_TETNG
MSRDESHGVVLTGYHSNAELLPKAAPRAPARPSAVDPEPTAPRTQPSCSPRNSPRSRSRPPPSCQRCNSQDSLDELEMNDYWKEVENIASSEVGAARGDSEADGEAQNEEQQKVPEEGEQAEAWLKEAGLEGLYDSSVEGNSDQEDDNMGFLSTLTRTQAAAVERRVKSAYQTQRRRNRQNVPDVRDIFRPPETVRRRCTQLTPSDRLNKNTLSDFAITTRWLDTRKRAEGEEPSKSKEGSENGKKDVTSAGRCIIHTLYSTYVLSHHDKAQVNFTIATHNRKCVCAETETELNVEVAFSEQALSYRDNRQGTKVTSPKSPDDKLPNFKLLRDKTGQTRIGDLSLLDMKKVQRLVLVESTALFDTAGIDLKPHKAVKMKTRESGLFGVPLSSLLEQDQKRIPGTKVPFILQKLISHIEEQGLDTEGLLRIPGAATRIKALCQELESTFYDGMFPWEHLKQHDAASLLKLFIRELPHPLLTVEYLNAFTAIDKLPTKKQQLHALNLLVLLLPEASRDTLKALVEFFQRVIDHQAENKMTLNNVSVIMAPNIFMFKGFRSKITEQQEYSMAAGTANIVRLLIRYQNLLWTIPKFIMNQVRQQNMENQRKANKERAVRKLLKMMTTEKPPERTIPEESSQGFIRVHAPQFPKVSMAVELTEDLQASDVLTRFLSQDRSLEVKREDLSLYETGGNIKERCLDGETYMKDLIQLNPTAEWVIKV